MSTPQQPGSAIVTAMMCAAAATGQFIAGKATRDALYLAQFDVTSLPAMVAATSVVSICLVILSSKILRRVPPATFVPLLFAASALLLLVEWALVSVAPRVAATVVYLQISGVGPMLGSGFWLVASERFDPRTAKRRFGQIAGAGTAGGLLGSIVAERVAALLGLAATLPVLACLNLFCAWQVRRLATAVAPASGVRPEPSTELSAAPTRSGLRVLAEAPYLRQLAILVFLGTLGSALIDYVLKVEAVSAFGRGESLLRFFAAYYAGTSLITFLLQTLSSRPALERFGLATVAATPSVALLAGGLGGLAWPGLQSIMVARAGEAVFRGSLFRSGYELFYTPIPVSEKRAAKSLIDVGVDRLGDAFGAGVVQMMLLLAPARQFAAILIAATSCALFAMLVARRLNHGYIQTLERSLLHRAVELDLADVEDLTTRTIMLRTLRGGAGTSTGGRQGAAAGTPQAEALVIPTPPDPEIQGAVVLRSHDRDRIEALLRREEALPASFVSYVIPLLAWDAVSRDAIHALQKVAEEHVGELIDALIDPDQPFAVRRRLARVFSVCVSQRAADGLILGLDDQRFEVRFQCGRSLASILEKNARIRVDAERVYDVVLREVAVGRTVWQSHGLLDRQEAPEGRSSVDEFVKDRTNQGLAHVFTLLSLVLPREPLLIAYRGLHTDDPGLKGTALEYLEGVVPAQIRERLWPFLEDERPASRVVRPRQEILADLLRSHPSIKLNLEELERRGSKEPWQAT
jgi:hypothetical protein